MCALRMHVYTCSHWSGSKRTPIGFGQWPLYVTQIWLHFTWAVIHCAHTNAHECERYAQSHPHCSLHRLPTMVTGRQNLGEVVKRLIKMNIPKVSWLTFTTPWLEMLKYVEVLWVYPSWFNSFINQWIYWSVEGPVSIYIYNLNPCLQKPECVLFYIMRS